MMDFASHYQAFNDLCDKAHQDGWINDEQLKSLQHVELQQAESLFAEQTHRPLLIGLFGGTGVGKSSLLNRLAGESIARTGVERPCSHEVTLYLHQDFQIKLLPDELPVDQTKIAYHNEDNRRLAAWLDMPDMDSTEPHNRELVEAWMPYLDWIIYVVSPERYHDDIGWRFLHERGHRHVWLFVMNHWDQGRPEQLEDFRRRLQQEGFAQPQLIPTSCGVAVEDDQFAQLEKTVNRAIQDHGLELLQQFGMTVRLNDLKRQYDKLTEMIGTDKTWEQAEKGWQQTVSSQLDAILKGIGPQIKHQTKIVGGSKTSLETLPQLFDDLAQTLWPARQQEQLKRLNNQLIDHLHSASLATSPIQQALQNLLTNSNAQVHESIITSLQLALSKPGGLLHRTIHGITGRLNWLLPLAAALWAIEHLVSTFHAGTQGKAQFLGLDFAVHSLLMIGLAWLIPWFLEKQLKPGPTSVIKSGLKQGIDNAGLQLNQAYMDLWQNSKEKRAQFLQEIALKHQILLEQDAAESIPGNSYSKPPAL